MIHAHAPSLALRLLQAAVRRRIIRRGHSWLLAAAPSVLWGGKSVEIETDVGPMGLPTFDRSASALLTVGNLPHERRETALVREMASRCQVMLDVGAQFGWYTRLMARANAQATVWAFEPDPVSYQHLSANVSDLANVRSIHSGVGDRNGDAVLWRAPTRSDLNSTVRRVGPSTEIRMCTLDAFCQERGIATVDFVKCDVEGGEVAVLRGAKTLLSSSHPPVWMLEISEQFLAEAGEKPAALLGALTEHCPGRLFTQDEDANPVEIDALSGRKLNNVFFVPPKRLKEFRDSATSIAAKS